MEKKIKERLNKMRSFLQADNGDLEFVELNGKEVKVKLIGACGSCPHSMITIKEGIEKDLRDNIDSEITVIKV